MNINTFSPSVPPAGFKPTPHPRRKLSLSGKTLSILALGALVLVGGAVWLHAQPQSAIGTLSASPPNFVVNTPTTVTFTVRIDTPTLNPTTVELLRVDPSGQRLVTVGRMYDNGQGGDVKPGDRTFTTAAALNEPAIGKTYFRVTAAFRGDRQNAQSAAIAVDVDPFPLPPDPGEAGKQTLEGIDSDGDGMRDDLQRMIAIQYQDSIQTRRALTQLASAMQETLTVDESSSLLSTRHLFEAIDCLNYVIPSDAGRIVNELEAAVLNTEARTRAYLDADRQFGGRTYRLTPKAELSAKCR